VAGERSVISKSGLLNICMKRAFCQILPASAAPQSAPSTQRLWPQAKVCDAKLEKYWVKDVKTRVDLIPQHEWSENIAPVLNTIVDGSAGSWVSATTKLIRASGEDALADVWSGIRDLKKMFSCVRNKRALYSPELLEEKMRDDFQDVEAALKSKIALRMYATNLGTGAQTCFTTHHATRISTRRTRVKK